MAGLVKRPVDQGSKRWKMYLLALAWKLIVECSAVDVISRYLPPWVKATRGAPRTPSSEANATAVSDAILAALIVKEGSDLGTNVEREV